MLVTAAPGAAGETGLTVSLRVTGGIGEKGQIVATLFDSEQTYMRSSLRSLSSPVDATGSASFAFQQLTPGNYAISVIYDENGNGELDTGLFGVPTEKVGFSNNARGRFGPAKWSKAQFPVSNADLRMEIRLDRAKK